MWHQTVPSVITATVNPAPQATSAQRTASSSPSSLSSSNRWSRPLLVLLECRSYNVDLLHILGFRMKLRLGYGITFCYCGFMNKNKIIIIIATIIIIIISTIITTIIITVTIIVNVNIIIDITIDITQPLSPP